MTRSTPPRAVVFDLDGTLIDSLPYVLAAIVHAVEPFGGRPTENIFATLGGPPDRFMTTLVNDLKDVPVALQRMEAFHRENMHLIRPFEGVMPLLERLRAAGVQLAIWTGRDRVSADWLLRQHAIHEFFSTVVCGDDLPTHKPDPAGLVEIMSRLGVKPSETLFVGDADVDVLGGEACGVDTLLIRHRREIELHVANKSWHVVSTPGDAFEVVMRSLGTIT
jgi:HAD superfamily hydrolase (TIGR01509 family)